MKYKPGQILTFNTTSNDMMNLNGAKCKVIEGEDDHYYVEFIDVKMTVFEDELLD